MMDITRTLIDQRQFLHAIDGLRLSYGSGNAMDSTVHLCLHTTTHIPDADALTIATTQTAYYNTTTVHGSSSQTVHHNTTADFVATIGEADAALLRRCLRGEKGENKFLRTIDVSCFIRAPILWWSEMDTYRIAPPDESPVASYASMAVRQSTSKMHRLARHGLFTVDDFDEDPTDTDFLAYLNELNAAWLAWKDADGRRQATDAAWMRWQKMIRVSYCYTSHWKANYAILRNIYAQRRHHRLSVYWKPFCAWIEGLPHSWLMTEYGGIEPCTSTTNVHVKNTIG